jgi:hypothetical protein
MHHLVGIPHVSKVLKVLKVLRVPEFLKVLEVNPCPILWHVNAITALLSQTWIRNTHPRDFGSGSSSCTYLIRSEPTPSFPPRTALPNANPGT